MSVRMPPGGCRVSWRTTVYIYSVASERRQEEDKKINNCSIVKSEASCFSIGIDYQTCAMIMHAGSGIHADVLLDQVHSPAWFEFALENWRYKSVRVRCLRFQFWRWRCWVLSVMFLDLLAEQLTTDIILTFNIIDTHDMMCIRRWGYDVYTSLGIWCVHRWGYDVYIAEDMMCIHR